MRKKIFLLTILLMATAYCMAQTENGGFTQRKKMVAKEMKDEKKSGKKLLITTKSNNYELSLGPRVGFGLSMMSEGEGLYPGTKLSDGPGFGFDAGLGLNVRFGGKDSRGRALNGQGLIGVGLELNYASRSVKTKAEKNLNLGYVEIPVLFQIYPTFQSRHLRNLYIEVGPTFSILASSSPEKLQVEEQFSTTVYNTKDFKGGDIKGTIGVGYRFNGTSANDGFYANIRYNLGMSNLAGNFPGKISSVELSIGYLFKCVGGKINK